MEYRFLPVKKVHYGEHVVKKKLQYEINRINANRILIVTTKSLIKSQPYNDLLKILGHQTLVVKSKQHVPGNILMDQMDEVYKFKPNLILSIGGGSAIDAAKIVSLILAENIKTEAELFQYSASIREKRIGSKDFIPHFSIPTTLSAAEYTCIAGVTNSMDKGKYGFGHHFLTPEQVFLDPVYTVDTPKMLWFSTGMRSVDHAVETLYSPITNPVNESLSLKALEHLYRFLPLTKEDPSSLEFRLKCQLGSWMSLFSNINIKLGLSHSIGHQLGSFYDIPHGVTSSIILPHVMEYLAVETYQEQAKIYDVITPKIENISPKDKAKEAANYIKDLVVHLEIPYQLREYNIQKEELSKVVKAILMDIKGENNQFILKVDRLEQDLLSLLQKAW